MGHTGVGLYTGEGVGVGLLSGILFQERIVICTTSPKEMCTATVNSGLSETRSTDILLIRLEFSGFRQHFISSCTIRVRFNRQRFRHIRVSDRVRRVFFNIYFALTDIPRRELEICS